MIFGIVISGGVKVSTCNARISLRAEDVSWPLKKADKQ